MIGFGLWAVLAQAQDGAPNTDLHGSTPPLGDGAAASPVTVRSAPRLASGAWRVGVLAEAASSPATQFVVDGSTEQQEVLLGPLVGANVGASYGFGRRLGIEAMLPAFRIAPEARLDGTQTGWATALGDLRVRVPIGLVVPDGPEGTAVGLAPFGIVPTGSRELQVGSGGGGGMWALAGHRTGRVAADLAVAVSWVPSTGTDTQRLGGLQLPVGGALGVRPFGRVWVGAEARLSLDPGSAPVLDGTSTPGGVQRSGEALLSVRGDLGGKGAGLWSGAAAGTAIGRGPGSAPFRAFVGASIGDDGREEVVAPVVAVAGPVVVEVKDPAGLPVADAQILADGVEVARTGGAGQAEVDGALLWPRSVQVVVGERPPIDVPAPETEQTGPVVVALAPEPRSVELRVTDLEGAPVVGTWQATSNDGAEREGRTGAGATMALPPGTWRVRLTAPGRGEQVRSVVVDPSGSMPKVEAVLAPEGGAGNVAFDVVDASGAGVGGARVLLDGLPVGATSSGGVVSLAGLSEGDHTLVVEKVGFATVERTVATGASVEPVVLVPVPGTVRVSVRGPDGAAASDAIVRFLGPSRLPAVPVDALGERVQVLGPGDWSLVITSPTLGGQARSLRIDEDQTGVQVLEVSLRPSEGGVADLDVAVLDPNGRPVDGAEVLLGGFALGTTGSGGRMRIDELALGDRSLEIQSELLAPVPPVDLTLVAGPQEIVVPVQYRPGAVQVRGVGADGMPLDATLRLVGPAGETLDRTLGEDGVERFVLTPGDWSLFAASVQGTQERTLSVTEADAALQRVDLVFRPSEGGLAELEVRLVDADGRPVPDARVQLDGYALGSTGSDGALRMDELAVGARELVVESGLHAPLQRPIRLLEGELVVEETLEWASGATRLRAVDADGAAVADAIVRVLGPQPVPMGPVDDEGLRTVLLAPGAWQVLASSPSRGVGLLSFPVPEDASDLLRVDVTVEDVDGSLADLVLRVVDGDGLPVVGAAVELDGSPVGQTGQGGVLMVDELRPASFRMVVRHPAHPPTTSEVVLPAGVTDRIVPMAWTLRPVRITVTDDSGAPVSTEVQWRGPADMERSRTDSNGVATALLRPGAWQALVSGDELGPGRVDFQVDDVQVAMDLVLGRSRVEVSAEGIAITEQVLFDFDADTLRAEARPVLDQVASALLAADTVVRVEVQGHTDATGDPAYNLALSESRATAVRRALVERGVPAEVLSARGYGPQRPVADNATPEGRSQNRRVAFEVLERGVR